MKRDVETRSRLRTPVLLVVLTIWGLAVAIAAETGVYRALPPLLLATIIALGIVIPALIYATSTGFRSYIEAIGPRPLTAFHIWRIAAALVFFWYGARGFLPEIFVQDAGWGDLITGLLAVGVILLPESRGRYLAFHIVGFADLVVAIGTGLTFFLLHDPRMAAITTLPMALIILYGVGISGASHIMAFDLLRRCPSAERSADAADQRRRRACRKAVG